jgi:hypothetical protein
VHSYWQTRPAIEEPDTIFSTWLLFSPTPEIDFVFVFAIPQATL